MVPPYRNKRRRVWTECGRYGYHSDSYRCRLFGKTYINPREYASSEDVSGTFTLQDGDVIVKGSVMEDLRPADLHKRHYEAVTILGVTDNRQFPNAPHWRVTGR